MTEVAAVRRDPSWDGGRDASVAAQALVWYPPCSRAYLARAWKLFNHVPSHLERATQRFSIFGCPKTQLWELGGLFFSLPA